MFLKAMILIPVLKSYRDLLKPYSLMMNTAVFLKTLYLWGNLTINACFTVFYSVWVVLSTVDQLVSNGELILVSRGFNVSVHPMSLLFCELNPA